MRRCCADRDDALEATAFARVCGHRLYVRGVFDSSTRQRIPSTRWDLGRGEAPSLTLMVLGLDGDFMTVAHVCRSSRNRKERHGEGHCGTRLWRASHLGLNSRAHCFRTPVSIACPRKVARAVREKQLPTLTPQLNVPCANLVLEGG